MKLVSFEPHFLARDPPFLATSPNLLLLNLLAGSLRVLLGVLLVGMLYVIYALSQLKQNSENTFYVIDLDTLWNWDRENEMRFIYKILDLMNRNYEVESLNPSLKNKYLIEARHKCKGLT